MSSPLRGPGWGGRRRARVLVTVPGRRAADHSAGARLCCWLPPWSWAGTFSLSTCERTRRDLEEAFTTSFLGRDPIALRNEIMERIEKERLGLDLRET